MSAHAPTSGGATPPTPANPAPPTAGSDQARSQGRSLLQRIFLGRETAPRWARPALWGVLLLATAVYVYGLGQNGDANSYYAAAVLSGTKSWSSMFFGSLDTGNFITVDKPPFALWVMEVSCRIFGFGTWQMLLPIAACGIAAVGILYSAVRRVFGHTAATVAGVVLALTPITVAITRDNNPDPVLVLLTVAAAWCCLESIRSGKLQPLVWCAVLVGFAFNTKMLQAYMVLPAFFLAYVWAAKGSVLKRVRNLLIAGVALVVSSGWWMVIVDSIPKSDRPFVGSSTKDTVWDLVTGYNGLARITGDSGGAGGGGGGGANFGGTAGVGRLFNDILGGQISWLIPFAGIALVGALVLRGRRRRTDLQRASYLLWGGWLLTHYVTFSFASGTFHPYYTTMLAPAIAALTGAGGTAIFRAFRVRSAAWSWVLPLGIVVSAVWAVVLLRRSTSFDSWLWPTIAVLALAAVVFLLVARFGKVAGPLFTVGAAAALIALLAGPAAYAADTATGGAVNGTNPSSGPSSGGGFGGGAPGGGGGFGGGAPGGTGEGQRGERPTGTTGGQGFPGGGQAGEMPGGGQGAPGGQTGQTGTGQTGDLPTGGFPGGTDGGAPTGGTGGAGGGFGGGGGMGGGVDSQMLSYLEAHQDGATWLVATSSAMTADEIILQSGGKAAIAMGGFTGVDPAMSLSQIKEYISSGKLHYVLVGGAGGMGGGQANSEATSYVTSTCSVVSASAYGGTSSSSTSTSTTATGTSSTEQLYYCKS